MDYRVEKKEAFDLIGFKRRFTGDTEERLGQEKDFWVETREQQNILMEIRKCNENIWYDIIL